MTDITHFSLLIWHKCQETCGYDDIFTEWNITRLRPVFTGRLDWQIYSRIFYEGITEGQSSHFQFESQNTLSDEALAEHGFPCLKHNSMEWNVITLNFLFEFFWQNIRKSSMHRSSRCWSSMTTLTRCCSPRIEASTRTYMLWKIFCMYKIA